jgi:hypothetical protein
MLEQLKETVCKDNKALPKNGLVLWTSGNDSVSGSFALTFPLVHKTNPFLGSALLSLHTVSFN